ncbi:MAG: hypothetical protein ACK2U9_12260, partial [Anaerolineae bacterium]
MPSPIRLLSHADAETGAVRFELAFAAPDGDEPPACAPARLFAGEPQVGEAGSAIAEIEQLCAPTAVTWHHEHSVELATYTYATPGPHTVSLRWGDLITSTTFDLGQPQTAGATPPPQVMLFQAEPLPDDSSQVTVRL